MKNKLKIIKNSITIILVPVLLTCVLVLLNIFYGFLLFHTFAELFASVVGILMFVVVWNTHEYVRNSFLLYLGVGYFWVAILDIFHALTFKGLPFFDVPGTNVTVQFWLYTRYLETVILVTAPIFFRRELKGYLSFYLFGLVALVIFVASLYIEQPVLIIEGQGLTPFKIISEYIIIAILLISMVIYWRAKDTLSHRVRFYMVLAIAFTVCAEFSFTQYVHVYGMSNQVGHIFKVFSFWMVYEAIVQTTLKKPFSVMSLAANSYDAVPYPAVFVDKNGFIQQANKTAKREYVTLKTSKADVHMLMHPKNLSVADCVICQHIRDDREMPATVIKYPENNEWHLISLSPLQLGDYSAGFIQVSTNITDYIEVQHKLLLANSVFNNLDEGIMVTDQQLKIISVNPAFSTITGYSIQDVMGESPRVLSSGQHQSSFYQDMWSDIKKKGYWQGEIWNRKKNGEIYPELLTISEIKSEEGSVINYVGAFTDITKIKTVEEQLHHLAHHDPLTGLPNRTLFSNLLDIALKDGKRLKNTSALLFIDLDDFKKINDSLGHSVGDTVLVKVAKHFKEALRDDYLVSRQGGDEFMVFMEDFKSLEDVATIAEKLISTLTAPIHFHENQPLFIGASIGIAIFPSDAESSERLIQYADAAMYKAKALGHNRFQFHTNKNNTELTRRLQVETQLRQAIKNHELFVVYQPKVNARTYEIEGAEALVRWKNPVLGNVFPDEFIPIAESIGVIQELGEFVLSQALGQVVKWRKLSNRNISIAVNFSSRQFMKEGLSDLIKSHLHQANLPGNALEVEITESLLLNHNELIVDTLTAISEQNITITIDDFGTGYSALSYLKNLPINVVKIDKSFIQDVMEQEQDAILVKTIILMAHGLNMSVVAEGIETKQQLTFYQVEQGDLVQGYYFSKPLTADDFVDVLNKWDTEKWA